MTMESQKNVQQHLVDMIMVESHLEEVLDSGKAQSKKYDKLTAAIEKYNSMAKNHRKALKNRLMELNEISNYPDLNENGDISVVMGRIFGALSEAALGYSILQSLAHRSFDRENTRDMIKQHLKDYAECAAEIYRIIFETTVLELDGNSDECLCHCTTCELGICTCAPMGIGRASKEWFDTVSADALGNIMVTAPRQSSAAINSGLQSGDVILSADGQEIHANAELHAAIKKHSTGEPVQLTVKHTSGDIEDIQVTC